MGLTFIDWFAGVGGFRRGMEQAGHTCIGHCEVDKYADCSYRAIHNVKEGEWFNNDIRRTNADDIPRADCWCFGFPCQDISVAGKQLGFKGNRSSLFFTVTRLIRDTKEENRPKYLFIENVKNLLSVNGGTDFLKLLIELDEIGFDCEWQVCNSKDYGVPQNRERVFIIGHLRGRSTRKVFPIGGNSQEIGINQIMQYNSKTRKNTNRYRVYDNEGISPCLGTMEGGGLVPHIKVIGTTKPAFRKIGQRDLVYSTDGIMSCLNATDYKQPKQILIRENTKKGYVEAEEYDGIRLDHIGGTTGRGRVKPHMCNTLTTGSHCGVIDKGFRIRKLTPLECWRLQGWNDEDFYKAKEALCDTFYNGKDKADSQLYKQAGNGVTTTVIKAIAEKLE